MTIAVCDENPADLDDLISMIRRYFREREISLELNIYDDNRVLLDDIQDSIQPDLIFLEIERDSQLGIDAAYRLRSIGYRNDLVLCSSTSEFAIYGYEIEAAGYLPKPYDRYLFVKIMDRIINHFSLNTYLIKHRRSITKVPLNEILYIESNNSKCTVHTSIGNDYVIYKHLNQIETELADRRFLRCHRSYLVNMNCISAVDTDFILNNGERILIRQKSRREIKNIFMEYMMNMKN